MLWFKLSDISQYSVLINIPLFGYKFSPKRMEKRKEKQRPMFWAKLIFSELQSSIICIQWNMEQFSNIKILCAQRPLQWKHHNINLKWYLCWQSQGAPDSSFAWLVHKEQPLQRQLQPQQLHWAGPGAGPDPAWQPGCSHSREEPREQPWSRNSTWAQAETNREEKTSWGKCHNAATTALGPETNFLLKSLFYKYIEMNSCCKPPSLPTFSIHRLADKL